MKERTKLERKEWLARINKTRVAALQLTRPMQESKFDPKEENLLQCEKMMMTTPLIEIDTVEKERYPVGNIEQKNTIIILEIPREEMRRSVTPITHIHPVVEVEPHGAEAEAEEGLPAEP